MRAWRHSVNTESGLFCAVSSQLRAGADGSGPLRKSAKTEWMHHGPCTEGPRGGKRFRGPKYWAFLVCAIFGVRELLGFWGFFHCEKGRGMHPHRIRRFFSGPEQRNPSAGAKDQTKRHIWCAWFAVLAWLQTFPAFVAGWVEPRSVRMHRRDCQPALTRCCGACGSSGAAKKVSGTMPSLW